MQKVRLIEGMRGILALWVLLGHTLAAGGLGDGWRGPFKLIATGGEAVNVFIVISGFVIFYLLDVARENYRRFIWRRFLRLYPVYFVCLIGSAFLLDSQIEAYSSAPWPSLLNASRVQIAQDSLTHLPAQLLAHLTMAHALIPPSWLPSSNYAILGQAWSLSLEWQFYFLAPLLFGALSVGGRRAWAVICVAVTVHFLVSGPEGFLPRHVPYFALGVASYYLWRQPWRPDWPLFIPTGVALTYFMTHDAASVIWAAIFLCAFREQAPEARMLHAILETRLALWLGKASYSIYLAHGIVLSEALLVLRAQGAVAFGQWPFFVSLLALTLGGTLIVSWALFTFIESPCIALGKRQSVPSEGHGLVARRDSSG